MRICVLIDAWEPVWGGGQTHVWEICKRLVSDYGYDVHIFTRALIQNSERKAGDESYYDGKLRVVRVGSLTAFYNPLGRLWWLLQVIISIVNRYRKYPYDILHAHAYTAAIPGKILSFFLKCPLVFTVHGSNNLDLRPQSVVGLLEKWLLTGIRYDCEVTVSQHFLRYPNINKFVVVIPNGTDVQVFDQVKIRKRKKTFRLLWVGRFDKIKGIDILLQSMRLLVQKEIFLELHLIGYGYEEAKYRQMVHDMNLHDSVFFKGRKVGQDLIKEYQNADLFVLPSLSEGQSIVLLEACAAKLPVVATNVGDNNLLIQEGKTGYLVPPNDALLLAQALMRAVKDPDLRKMGHNAYQLVKEKYQWEKSVEQLARVYGHLLTKYNA